MANSLTLWINPESQRLLANSSSLTSAQRPVFYSGNEVDVELHLISGTGVSRIPYEIAFPAGCTIKVSVGGIANPPSGGDWRLSVSSVETTDLPHNATALQVETALNALAPVSSAGGVSVDPLGGGYSITWNTAGVKPPILAGTDTLTPSAYESIYILQTGDSVTREVVFVELRQSPVSLTETFTPIAAPVVTSTVVQAWNGINKVVRIAIAPAPQNGSYGITIGSHSASVNAFASAIDIRSALASAGATSVVSVNQTGSLQFDIVLSADNTVTVNGNGLVQSSGYAGTLSFATSEVISFLGSNATASAVLEIIVESAGITTTVCQVPCTIANGVISSGAVAPITFGVLLTESVADARYLRRDVSQSPSAGDLNIIWSNLGLVIGNGSDVADAINASDYPSVGNPFLTLSAGNALFSGAFNQSLNTTDNVLFNYVSAPTLSGFLAIDDRSELTGSTLTMFGTGGEAGMIVSASSITFPDDSVQSTAFNSANYLTESQISSTYQTISGMSSYLTTASAASTYQTQAGMSSYLTTATAASTYAPLTNFDQPVRTTDDVVFNSVGTGPFGITVGYAAITFPDGSTQETAASGSGLSNSYDYTTQPWEIISGAGSQAPLGAFYKGMTNNNAHDSKLALKLQNQYTSLSSTPNASFFLTPWEFVFNWTSSTTITTDANLVQEMGFTFGSGSTEGLAVGVRMIGHGGSSNDEIHFVYVDDFGSETVINTGSTFWAGNTSRFKITCDGAGVIKLFSDPASLTSNAPASWAEIASATTNYSFFRPNHLWMKSSTTTSGGSHVYSMWIGNALFKYAEGY